MSHAKLGIRHSKLNHPGKFPTSLDPTVSIRIPMTNKEIDGQDLVIDGSIVKEVSRMFCRKWLGTPKAMVREAS